MTDAVPEGIVRETPLFHLLNMASSPPPQFTVATLCTNAPDAVAGGAAATRYTLAAATPRVNLLHHRRLTSFRRMFFFRVNP